MVKEGVLMVVKFRRKWSLRNLEEVGEGRREKVAEAIGG